MDPSGATAGDCSADLYCPQCGYNLRGIESRRCPECGVEVDRAALSANRIPWEHRASVGRFRAYVRTVWLATMRPKELAQSMNAPVSYSAARRFWLITVLLAWLAFSALVFDDLRSLARDDEYIARPFMVAVDSNLPSGAWLDLQVPFLAGVFALLIPVLLLFLLAATGLVSYFFHPNPLPIERQNRAVAMSYYACGPLAWAPLPSLGLWGIVALDQMTNLDNLESLIMPIVVALILFQLIVLLAWWNTSWRLLKYTTHATAERTLVVAVVLPVLWALLAVLIVGGLTWIAGLLRLMYLSLQ